MAKEAITSATTRNHPYFFSRTALSLAIGLAMAGSHCIAQSVFETAKETDEPVLEEIVVTSSRRPINPAESMAPLDIIDASELASAGATDMEDLLRFAVPSYNVNRQAIGGVATAVRPATLRGLSPDSTLILVNGKRRHRAAVIVNYAGGFDNGSQGPDVSTIPTIALDSVQVLRDGAAAQYGADAVAGIINFILSDEEGGNVQLKYGSTYEGDGDRFITAGRYGFSLGETGYLALSGEYSAADPTSRSIQRADAAALIDAGIPGVPDPAIVWGDPDVDYNVKTFINFGVELGKKSEFYGWANYAKRDLTGGLAYRNPNNRSGFYTFSQDGTTYRLVGDMTPDDAEVCPGAFNFISNQGPVEAGTAVVAGSPEDAALLSQLATLSNCFAVNEIYPGGFTPQFTMRVEEFAGTSGIRGTLDSDLKYDFSYTGGRHEARFGFENNINPSLGPAAPREYDSVGTYINLEHTFNADFSYPLEVSAFESPLNIAAGYEYRSERFESLIGQPESWEAGPLNNQGFAAGVTGFTAFNPDKASRDSRHNHAAYVDLEADITEKLVLGAAVRYENFSDFGGEGTYKVSARYNFSNEFAVRLTNSTGFRAPTIGQQNFQQSTTVANADGTLSVSGQISPTNPVAVVKGGKTLEAETSDSTSIGFVYSGDLFTFEIDVYKIEMEDRITQTQSFSLTQAEIDSLKADGFLDADQFSSFNFFTNNFNTETKGVDIVLSVPLDIVDTGSTKIDLSANYNETEITSIDLSDPLEPISETRRIQLEEGFPKYKGSATLSHTADSWRALARVNFHGDYTELFFRSASLPIEADGEVTLDVEVEFDFSDDFGVVVGAENLLNETPTSNPYPNVGGAEYGETPPFGFNGGFYYIRGVYEF